MPKSRWRQVYKINKDAGHYKYKPIVAEHALEVDALGRPTVDPYRERWEAKAKMIKPVAKAMEQLGFPDHEIVFWVTSGWQSSTQSTSTENFASLVIQLANLLKEQRPK